MWWPYQKIYQYKDKIAHFVDIQLCDVNPGAKERGFNNFPILTCLFTLHNRE